MPSIGLRIVTTVMPSISHSDTPSDAPYLQISSSPTLE